MKRNQIKDLVFLLTVSPLSRSDVCNNNIQSDVCTQWHKTGDLNLKSQRQNLRDPANPMLCGVKPTPEIFPKPPKKLSLLMDF